MLDLRSPETTELEPLRRLCALATRKASTVMTRWIGRRITLDLTEVRETPLERVCGELGIGDELHTMVVLGSAGALGADVVLLFGETAGRRLAATLLGCEPGQASPWEDLEKSALTETGNILACAYLNAVAEEIGQDLFPTSPYLIRDYGASVVQQAIMVQAAETDRVLICQTTFQQDGEPLEWQVLFIPTEAMRRRVARPQGTGV